MLTYRPRLVYWPQTAFEEVSTDHSRESLSLKDRFP